MSKHPLVRLRTAALLTLAFSCGASFAEQRVPWTTSHIQGTPEPPPPFVVERIFPTLTLNRPVDIQQFPGTDRLVVMEELATLRSFVPGTDKAEDFANLAASNPEIVRAYSITFHPRFAENRFAYVFAIYDLHGKDARENGSHIIRFRVTDENPPKLDIASGKILFSWPAGGHNGGNLRFGPDGMLYFSTGDGTRPDPPDGFVSGQDMTKVFSSVLRIDVDHPDAGRAYGIPKDNPFVNTPGARGEKWAYGLRNPWRISFDSKSGELFAGDVGWELWEMIYRVKPGRNFGWSITEGSMQDVRPDRLRGPTPIVPPLVAHSHEEAASITGGEFYHGTRLPELKGAYIYGDWQMGTFWSLRTDGDKVTDHRELARTSLMPAAFGVMRDGELIIADHSGGGLWRLAPNPRVGKNSDFPRKLSGTGLFTDTRAQTPAAGVLPFEINAELWADHATAERWVAFPDQSGAYIASEAKGVVLRGRWGFPPGAVFAKTYSLEMERGNAATRKRIETQILHFDGSLWGTYTYRWNAEQTEAELVPLRGDEATFTIKDKAAPGGEVKQPWRFFSRSECARCHTLMNDFVQGFSAPQLDRTTGIAPGDQLDLLTSLGLTPEDPRMADPHGKHGSIEVRARSYLHVNCGICHRFNAGGAVPSYMNIETPLKEASLINALPTQGELGLPEGRVIAPGDPARSVLLYRMATAGRGHMPYLGGKLVDDRGLLLVRDWIASLKSNPRTTTAATRAQREAEELSLAKLKAGDAAQLDPLLATGSGALSVLLAMLDNAVSAGIRAQAIAKGSALSDPLRRDLFERFLPESQRRRVLGTSFKPQTVLALKGDASRGKTVFGGVCVACHRVSDVGIDFGPDLGHVGTKWNRAAMLEQILTPSKIIEPQWLLATVELKDGGSKTGFIASRTDAGITMKMAGGVIEKIPTAQIEKTSTALISMMPEGLLQNLTAQEAADLIEYLDSLK